MGHVTRAERGWLAGLIDGEGSISGQTNGEQRLRVFNLQIAGSDPRTMHKAQRILEVLVEHPVHMGVYDNAARGYKMFHISVRSLADLIQVLAVVIRDLSGKREEAQVLLDHLNWRAMVAQSKGLRTAHGRGSGWTGIRVIPDEVVHHDIECVNLLRKLKRSYRVRTDHTESDELDDVEDMIESPERSGSATENEPSKM